MHFSFTIKNAGYSGPEFLEAHGRFFTLSRTVSVTIEQQSLLMVGSPAR